MNQKVKGLPDSIGLTLSGGGYRAAAFHLGTIAYLERVGLIPRLKMLSTVSGGTFTGAKYTLSLIEGISFGEFFRDFYAFLQDTDLIRLGLNQLGREIPDVPSGRRDLIVSVAQVYADTFLKAPDGEPYRFGSILNADIPLKEVIFNTTEFRNGIAFRFQHSATKGLVGNYYLSIPRNEAAKIRIADIVAASSCFPGGFEPIGFPDDFAWPEGEVPKKVYDTVYKDPEKGPIALMDGGIFDNQGIDSMLLAEERDPGELDMFIISDVDRKSDELYRFPKNKSKIRLTLSRLNLLAWIIMVSCVLTVLAVGYEGIIHFIDGHFRFWDFFLYLVPLFLSGLTASALWWGRNIIRREILPDIPQVGRAAWKDLKRLTLGQILDMANLRFTSLLAMATSVFMKRIRSLGFRLVYENEAYNGKRVANLIYHITKSDEDFAEDFIPDNVKRAPDEDICEYMPKGVLLPSRELRNIVTIAAKMPTTLWFDESYQLPCLAACGQATLCYNLMKFIVRNHGTNAKLYPEDVQVLWDRLVNDWKVLVADPYALLRELLPDTDLPIPPGN